MKFARPSLASHCRKWFRAPSLVMHPDRSIQAGLAALDRGEWLAALHCFDEALAARGSAAAHDGRAQAAWWVDQADVVFASREQAYRLYREQGDARNAARVAVWLAWDHDAFRGETAVAGGWLTRARELLEEFHDTPEYAWLCVRESAFALLDHSDPTRALQYANDAVVAARAAGSTDFEMVGRSLRGFALATSGQIAEGMRELDGVAAAILGGEVRDRLAIGLSCCYLIAACDRVRDYDRAVQWCRRLKAYCEQWQFLTLFAVCRTQYAAVCMWRGAWTEAETELESAATELGAVRPGMIAEALVRLGELRRRQGRLDEAYALFARAGAHPLGMVGRALVAADRGEWGEAADLAERHLRQLPVHNRTERASALELLVRAAVMRGQPSGAAEPLAQLEQIALDAGTRPLRALTAQARGVAAVGGGDDDAARRHFEDAVDLFAQSGATYERAMALLDLAETLQRLGRAEAAMREAGQAEALLSGVDAGVSTERVRRLRSEVAREPALPVPHTAPRHGPAVGGIRALTTRERDVLVLITRGLSNAAMAESLGISEHTVHRHVANILAKLNVTSRSAAVAHAARLGLL